MIDSFTVVSGQKTLTRNRTKLRMVKTTYAVLSNSASFTITIVAETILTIVNSFTIDCFPIMNLLILLVGLCSSVLSLHCSTVHVTKKLYNIRGFAACSFCRSSVESSRNFRGISAESSKDFHGIVKGYPWNRQRVSADLFKGISAVRIVKGVCRIV